MAWQGCCHSQPCPNRSHTKPAQARQIKNDTCLLETSAGPRPLLACVVVVVQADGSQETPQQLPTRTHRRTVDSLTMQLCLDSHTSPARSSRTQQTQTHTCTHTPRHSATTGQSHAERRNKPNQLSLPPLRAAFDVSSSSLVSAPPGNSACDMHPAGNKACCALTRGWAGLLEPGTPNHDQTQHRYCCAPVPVSSLTPEGAPTHLPSHTYYQLTQLTQCVPCQALGTRDQNMQGCSTAALADATHYAAATQ
jgi:hypothetical protein